MQSQDEEQQYLELIKDILNGGDYITSRNQTSILLLT